MGIVSPEEKPRTQRRKAKGNGEGSIYQTADGRHRGAIAWKDPETGALRRKMVSAGSVGEVRRKLTELRSNLDRGIAPSSSMTLSAYLGHDEKDGDPATGWLAQQRDRVRASTFRHREQCVRLYILPALGTVRLDALTPAHVERMTGSLIASGRSARTAAHARVVLRTALQDANRRGVIHRNVAGLAKAPRVESSDIRYLDPTQIRTLLTACVTDRKDRAGKPKGPPELGNLFALAATTGLRQGELLGLSWDAVDLEARRLTVRRALARDRKGGYALAEPKTPRSRRSVHLPAAAVTALKRQQALQDGRRAALGPVWQDTDDLVFTDAVGRPLRGDSVNASLRRLLGQAKLPLIPFHGLRHSAATALLAAGVPLRTVADQLGHSTIVLTANTYGHVIPESRSEAAAAMDRVLGDG